MIPLEFANFWRSVLRSIGFGTDSQTFKSSALPSSATPSQRSLSAQLNHDDLCPASYGRQKAKHVDSDVLPEPEIERDAVELPLDEHFARIFVAVSLILLAERRQYTG